VLERVWDGLKDAGKAVFPITLLDAVPWHRMK
jgi:hypothetical protein